MQENFSEQMDNMKDYELSRDLQNTKSIKKPFSSKDAENILLENVFKGMCLRQRVKWLAGKNMLN